MRSFKDFGIKVSHSNFIGKKLGISQILNREITVLDYKIVDSKIQNGGKCLHLQIEMDGYKHVAFLGSKTLMEAIEQVPKDDGFPFKTIIIQDDKRHEFT